MSSPRKTSFTGARKARVRPRGLASGLMLVALLSTVGGALPARRGEGSARGVEVPAGAALTAVPGAGGAAPAPESNAANAASLAARWSAERNRLPPPAPIARPPATPPPFAPGGDDVMTWELASDATSTRGVLATPPGVMAWVESPALRPAYPLVVRISTRGAWQCRASGLPAGATLESAGNSRSATSRLLLDGVPPGVYRLTLRCSGTGDEVETSLTVKRPLPLHVESWLNRPPGDPGDPDDPGNVLQAFGDFFQQGRWSRLALQRTGDGGLELAFFARAEGGRGGWKDRSVELLANPAERRVCDSASRVLSSDFNADGAPDVFIFCRPQAGGVGAETQRASALLLLSGADGRYQRLALPQLPPAVDACVMDVDGDGLADLLLQQEPRPTSAPMLLLQGRGYGGFSAAVLHPLPGDQGCW